MLLDSKIHLVKLYFSITKEEQEERFKDIINSPLKRWKYSDVDANALKLWENYTAYKEKMFGKTNTKRAPWKIIKANKKTKARIEAIEHILKVLPYEVKDQKKIKHQVVVRGEE